MRAPSSTVLPLPTRPRRRATRVHVSCGDGGAAADLDAGARRHVHDRAVLHVGAGPHDDGVQVAAQHGVVPDDARSSTVTSPMMTAVGAMKAVGCTFGRLPSKLKSGMGSTSQYADVESPSYMTPRIAAVATAVPPYRYTQAQILALAGYGDERRRGFFTASDIEGRHLWIDPARFTPTRAWTT